MFAFLSKNNSGRSPFPCRCILTYGLSGGCAKDLGQHLSDLSVGGDGNDRGLHAIDLNIAFGGAGLDLGSTLSNTFNLGGGGVPLCLIAGSDLVQLGRIGVRVLLADGILDVGVGLVVGVQQCLVGVLMGLVQAVCTSVSSFALVIAPSVIDAVTL